MPTEHDTPLRIPIKRIPIKPPPGAAPASAKLVIRLRGNRMIFDQRQLQSLIRVLISQCIGK
jgi:hypothetical protein